MEFEKNVLKTIREHNMLKYGENVVIGLSGGADSVALALVLHRLEGTLGIKLHAAHVNHMIRGDEAYRDSAYAERLANDLEIEFHLLECDIPKKAAELGLSEEMVGREVRYGFFRNVLEELGGGKIAVAHHMGDNAETVILNMLRGSSLKGLGGIAPVNGNIIRPLICTERKSIEEYLAANSVGYMTDRTNFENVYTRNIIRNRILPIMEEINPSAVKTICANSAVLRREEELLSELFAPIEEKCLEKNGSSVIADFAKCPVKTDGAKSRIIIDAFKMLTGSPTGMTSAAVSSVLSLPTGKFAQFGGVYIQRSYEKLIFSNEAPQAFDFSYEITFPANLKIKETGREYSFEITENGKNFRYEKGVIYLDAERLGTLTVRSRSDGDVFSPLGLNGRKKVKDFLIDSKVSVTERGRLPILESDGKIAAILCLRADNAYKVTEKTKKILKICEVRND